MRTVPFVDEISSSRIRSCCTAARSSKRRRCSAVRTRSKAWSSRVTHAAAPPGFPTANVSIESDLLVPRRGSTPARRGGRAAISVSTNPHYGGEELRIEAFLLDFDGDLYGRSLKVELWRRLRGERVSTARPSWSRRSPATSRKRERRRRRFDLAPGPLVRREGSPRHAAPDDLERFAGRVVPNHDLVELDAGPGLGARSARRSSAEKNRTVWPISSST